MEKPIITPNSYPQSEFTMWITKKHTLDTGMNIRLCKNHRA
ncbi:hypothetical protein BN1088_1431237 [Sphingobacterium sp. PM2-P1-29]|nr:hypothetical protein BN1088_1431237 [Sphingobacterium sp. PM2-P1-29]